MHIANPIYDIVFKYLMADNKIAKLLISSIIGEEILELDFKPQDYVAQLSQKRLPRKKSPKQESDANEIVADKHPISLNLTVYRLDFSAKIKTKQGHRVVLIEVQKAKFPTDIMRFRGYLGANYSNRENTSRQEIKKVTRRVGTPIISIYFLGHCLDYTDATVIGVKREYIDLITRKPIVEKEPFIESLTHDSFIIQIPKLPHKRRNELEILLGVFDQSKKVDQKCHVLNIKEEDFPEKYRIIVRRLQKAILEPEVKKTMDLEDGIVDELEDMQRDIESLLEKNEQANQLAEEQKKRAEQESQRAEQEKKRAEQESQRAEQEKQRAEQEKQRAEIANRRMEQAEKEIIRLKKALKR